MTDSHLITFSERMREARTLPTQPPTNDQSGDTELLDLADAAHPPRKRHWDWFMSVLHNVAKRRSSTRTDQEAGGQQVKPKSARCTCLVLLSIFLGIVAIGSCISVLFILREDVFDARNELELFLDEQHIRNNKNDNQPWYDNTEYRDSNNEPWHDNDEFRDSNNEPWHDNDEFRDSNNEPWHDNDEYRGRNNEAWIDGDYDDYLRFIHDGVWPEDNKDGDEYNYNLNKDEWKSSEDFQDNPDAIDKEIDSTEKDPSISTGGSSKSTDSSEEYDACGIDNETNSSTVTVDKNENASSEENENIGNGDYNYPQYANYDDYYSKFPKETNDDNDGAVLHAMGTKSDNDASIEEYDYNGQEHDPAEWKDGEWPTYETDINDDYNTVGKESEEDGNYDKYDNEETNGNILGHDDYPDPFASSDDNLDTSYTTENPDTSYNPDYYDDWGTKMMNDYYGDNANSDDGFDTDDDELVSSNTTENAATNYNPDDYNDWENKTPKDYYEDDANSYDGFDNEVDETATPDNNMDVEGQVGEDVDNLESYTDWSSWLNDYPADDDSYIDSYETENDTNTQANGTKIDDQGLYEDTDAMYNNDDYSDNNDSMSYQDPLYPNSGYNYQDNVYNNQYPGYQDDDLNNQYPGTQDDDLNNQYPGTQDEDLDKQYPGYQDDDLDNQYPGYQDDDLNNQYPGYQVDDLDNQYPGYQDDDLNNQYPGYQDDDLDNQYPGYQDDDLNNQNPGQQDDDVDSQYPGYQDDDVDNQNPGYQDDDLDNQYPGYQDDDLNNQYPGYQDDDLNNQYPGYQDEDLGNKYPGYQDEDLGNKYPGYHDEFQDYNLNDDKTTQSPVYQVPGYNDDPQNSLPNNNDDATTPSPVYPDVYEDLYDDPEDLLPNDNDDATPPNPLYPDVYDDTDNDQAYLNLDNDGDYAINSDSDFTTNNAGDYPNNNDTTENYEDTYNFDDLNETDTLKDSVYEQEAPEQGSVGQIYVDDIDDLPDDTNEADNGASDHANDRNADYLGDAVDVLGDQNNNQIAQTDGKTTPIDDGMVNDDALGQDAGHYSKFDDYSDSNKEEIIGDNVLDMVSEEEE